MAHPSTTVKASRHRWIMRPSVFASQFNRSRFFFIKLIHVSGRCWWSCLSTEKTCYHRHNAVKCDFPDTKNLPFWHDCQWSVLLLTCSQKWSHLKVRCTRFETHFFFFCFTALNTFGIITDYSWRRLADSAIHFQFINCGNPLIVLHISLKCNSSVH